MEAHVPGQQEKPWQQEARTPQLENSPRLPQLEKRRPITAKNLF